MRTTLEGGCRLVGAVGMELAYNRYDCDCAAEWTPCSAWVAMTAKSGRGLLIELKPACESLKG